MSVAIENTTHSCSRESDDIRLNRSEIIILMKFSIEVCSYVSKSPYTYIVVRADEALTKFGVWGNIKAFNTLFYDEKRVLDLVHEKYPDSERIEKKLKSRKKISLTSK